ncbi:rRNA maturation RNase YbeY [Mesohalobacter halotolerans]|uniref:Endoribonuclease YbeY n=1 Tax=Mesohalobacter halotolerans TaxID=1883405 RepID=A0A4V6ALJ3_9FLAO|nr:rRNA maturation RNase YbeY [Mesohalobacter halotolerans]MBS3738279.1 rRNA maturation RNase YbeY [Psychroflexus sp.]TKS57165.1 rRNA maturation RNase YbeY [Mesohalobacter halotolerans]
MKAQINFNHLEKFDLNLESEVKNWLSKYIYDQSYVFTEINYNFYTDEELLEINQKHLDHDFYTDIITFDNTIQNAISADIAISLERVKDNAQKNNLDFKKELYRVMIHGILHCMGYNDKNESQKQVMRSEEDKALEMFHVEQNKN